MALGRAGKEALRRAVSELRTFRHGNLSGRVFRDWEHVRAFGGTGQLPRSAEPEDGPDQRVSVYVVYSYRTPIGWRLAYEQPRWIIPAVKYSVTTTNHQGVLRGYIPPSHH